MPNPVRSLLVLAMVIGALLALPAVAVRAASPGYPTTPHVSCSYPGAPDCNMGPPPTSNPPPSNGGCVNVTTFPSIIPQISPSGCGSANSGGCVNVTTFPSIIPQISPSGCGGSTSVTPASSNSCPSNYTPSPFGCQPPSNASSSLSSSGCSNGQVPATQVGILAAGVCVNPTSSNTSTNGPPAPQTKSCPGYAQQFPAGQNCPTQLPSSGCDIGARSSLDATPDLTVSQACGTNQASSSGTPCAGSPGITYSNDETACPHDLCSGGILAYPGPCASCNFGTAAGAAQCAQCPGGTGTYGGPDPNAAGCPQGTYCPVDGGTAYPPTSCQSCPGGTGMYLKDPTNCPKPPPAPTASASCGGSVLSPSMDLRVGQAQGPFFCVNCFLPGATTGTVMSSGDCILAGGTWNPDSNNAASGSGTTSSGAATSLPPDLDTSSGKPFDTCNTLLTGGAVLGSIFGSTRSPGAVANAIQSGGQSDFCAGLANAPHPGLDSNQWMACLNAALFPEFTSVGGNASTYSALSPDDAKAACLNVVPAVSGTNGR